MDDYICKICGYIYKPAENNDTDFNSLDDSWVCPVCSAKKENFEKI